MAAVLFSCSNDDAFREGGKSGEETVRASFSVSTQAMTLVGEPETDATRSTTFDDSKINSAYMFQFNGTTGGSTMVAHGQAISMANGKLVFDLALTASSSANRVYLLANAAGISGLPTSGTLANFEAAVLAFTDASIRNANGDTSGDLKKGGIPMIGYKDITPSSITEDDLSFSLERMAAKVTITVNSDIEDFKIISIQMKSVATGSRFAAPSNEYPTGVASNFADYERTSFVDGLWGGTSDYHTQRNFIWYVPENKRGTNAAITQAYHKGESYAPAYSTYIEVLASLPTAGVATYRIYPGANATTDFNIVRNTHYNLTVNITGISEFDLRVKEYGAANCFIVKPGEQILIPTNRVNKFAPGTITATQNALAVSIVWSDASANATKFATGDNSNIRSYWYFGAGLGEVIVVEAGNVEGNAVIAATLSGKIKWSWHVWVTDDPTETTYTNNGYTFMDRNLGATSADLGSVDALGLYYQWGRKDPFPKAGAINDSEAESTVYTTAGAYTAFGDSRTTEEFVSTTGLPVSMATAVENPKVFYWLDNTDYDWCIDADHEDRWGYTYQHKTIYDPCPEGWRVPMREAFTGFDTKVSNTYTFVWDTTNYGRYLATLGWWPAAGIRWGDSDAGQLNGVGSSGYYWSATPHLGDPYDAYQLYFNSGGVYPQSNDYRAYGPSVRCVAE